METLRIESIRELRALASAAPDGTLFRGQTAHYTNDDGAVSLLNSHYRNGCVPSELRKWSFYAQEVLTWFSEGHVPDRDLVQAVLQHYGWRSFFIDLSSRLEVACWFAGHKYGEQDIFQLACDYEDRDVVLFQRDAFYSQHDGDGHLYFVDSMATLEGDAKFIDLCGALPADIPTRYSRQTGWLVGPLSGIVPPEIVTTHITGPSALFRQCAAEAGVVTTSQLFPPPEEDELLRTLESIPWIGKRVESSTVYVRGLDLPNYHGTKKHLGPEVAFHFSGPLSRETEPPDMTPAYLVPTETFHARPEARDEPLTHVAELLRLHDVFRIETEELVRMPRDVGTPVYCKGVRICRHTDHAIEVSALIVTHPGMDCVRSGWEAGWFYELSDEGMFARVDHPDACRCNMPWRHEQLFTVLVAFNWLLQHYSRRKVSDLLTVLDGPPDHLVQLKPKHRK